MMASTITSKLLAIAVLIGACLPLLAGGLWFYQSYVDREQVIADELERLDRLRAIAARLPALEQMNPSEKTEAFRQWFLGKGTPAMLTAGLQARLRQLAAAQGVEVLQANETKPKEIDKLTYLGVALEMSGTASGLHGLLQQIEASVPLLFLDNVQIRSDYSEIDDQKRETSLVMSFQVFGALATDAAEPQSPDANAKP